MSDKNNVGHVSLPEKLFMRIVATVFFAGMVVLLENTDRINTLATLHGVPDKWYIILFVALFAGLSILQYVFKRFLEVEMDAIFLLGATLFYVFIVAMNTADIYYISMISIFTLVVFRYVLERHPGAYEYLELERKTVKKILIILFVVTAVYLGLLILLRLFLMNPVTFDFGIFVQMFHYMKETLIPYTTCERYELLSHFTIHFSPIFYLILPIYMIFPAPATLVVVQLLAVLSGVIPLYLMCKRKNAKGLVTLAICVAYLLYPTLRGGLFYDFHENKFLAPLIMWLLYFFEEENERKKRIGVIVFTILLLMVKEDAPLYAACIGLYHGLAVKERKHRRLGFGVFVFSLLYFFVVFYFMGKHGDAGSAITSFGRYENLTVNGYQGISGIVMNIVKDPAYVVKQLVSEEKVQFLLWMFFPVLFLPFFNKKTVTFVLLLPMLAMNLLSYYPYQHSIYYQYAYGSGALVIYLTYLVLSDMKGTRGKKYAILVIVASLLMSTSALSEKNAYFKDYKKNKEFLQEMHDMMESIPVDASVSASTSLVPLVAERREVYRYQEGDLTDYIAFNLRTADKNIYERTREDYFSKGYEIFGFIEGKLVILKKQK